MLDSVERYYQLNVKLRIYVEDWMISGDLQASEKIFSISVQRIVSIVMED